MPFKIFYIDDEPDLLELFSDTFAGPNIEIQTFEDANTAIEKIKKNPPDLLFIDYRLKGITGDKVALSVDQSIPKAMITGELNVHFNSPIFEIIFNKPYNIKAIEEYINKHAQAKAA